MERAERIGLGVAGAGHLALIALLSLGAFAVTRPITAPRPVEVSLVGETAPHASAPTVAHEAPAAATAPRPTPPAPVPVPAPPPATVSPPRPTHHARDRTLAPTLAKAPPDHMPRHTDHDTAPAPHIKPHHADRPDAKVSAKPKARPAKAPAHHTSREKASEPASKVAHDQPAAKPAAARHSLLGKDFLKGIASDSAGKAKAPAAPIASAAVRKSIDISVGARIRPFFDPPSGIDIDKLRVTVEMQLNPDGTLAGRPHCIRHSGETDSNAAQLPLFCERAIRAAVLAAPYPLPRDYYETWKVHDVTFRTQ